MIDTLMSYNKTFCIDIQTTSIKIVKIGLAVKKKKHENTYTWAETENRHLFEVCTKFNYLKIKYLKLNQSIP